MGIVDPNTGRLSKPARVVDWLGRNASPPLAFATAVAGAFLTYDWAVARVNYPSFAGPIEIVEGWIGVVFFCFAVAAFTSSYAQSRLTPSLVTLKGKVDLIGENLRTFCDGLMADLANKLAITGNDQSRISLYIHDGEQHFVLCGRYSPNPVLKKPGRPFYPDHQGCIAEGWRQNWFFENQLGVRKTYQTNTLARYQIGGDIFERLTMKSQMYGVKRIDCNNKAIGLIVVESLRQDRFDDDTLRVALEEAAVQCANILNSFRDYVPTPSIASRKGF